MCDILGGGKIVTEDDYIEKFVEMVTMRSLGKGMVMRMNITKLMKLGLLVGALGVSSIQAVADNAKVLIEKGIFLQETKKDFGEAIEVYAKALEQTEDEASEICFRMAMCSKELGDEKTRMEILRKLVENGEADDEWVKKAAEICSTFSVLEKAPWKDGEACRYEAVMGLQLMPFMSTRLTKVGESWKCQATRTSPNAGQSEAVFNAETYRPVSSNWFFEHYMDSEVSYDQEKDLILYDEKMDDVKPTELKMGADSLDNEQVIISLRAMPMTVGASFSFRLVSPIHLATGANGEMVTFTVDREEEVEVKAGKFACMKIKSAMGFTAWIHKEGDRELVRWQQPGLDLRLIEKTSVEALESRAFKMNGFDLVASSGNGVMLLPRVNAKKIFRADLHPESGFRHGLLEINHTKSLFEKLRGKPVAFIEEITRNEIRAAGKEGVDFKLNEDAVEKFEAGGRTYYVTDYSYPVMEKTTHIIRACADDGKVNVLVTIHYRKGEKAAAREKLEKFLSHNLKAK